MSLSLTNTISRNKEAFESLIPGKVSIYCCGVTVYDLCHLGHARSYISWDVLRRYFLWKGYVVNFVQNFTDIDDKILLRAAKDRRTMNEVSELNIKEFHKDMDALGILRPDSMPRATKCLKGIISFIEQLERKGFAYCVDGDVYFDALKKVDYGKLSGRDLLEQKSNAEGRVDLTEEARKKHPFDFALWKSVKPGEPSFLSPWGPGRPGWHIECSAMVLEELGDSIDIHLGGADLIFPHHENEIAQSECVTDKALARYWLHNGMVNVQGKKMSKSLGNFKTIRALLEEGISPMTLRLFVLQAHYRKPIDFTKEALESSAVGWKGLSKALFFSNYFSKLFSSDELADLKKNDISAFDDFREEELVGFRSKFVDAMDDDLNTSVALAVVFEMARPLRSIVNRLDRGDIDDLDQMNKIHLYKRWEQLVELTDVLGLRNKDDKLTNSEIVNIRDEKIILAIKQRNEAKINRDFVTADRIRDELKSSGIELIDKPGGKTEWIES